MFASRRLVTLLPHRPFSTTTLPHLSPALSQSTPVSPSRTLPRPSPLAHHHPGRKGYAQTRPFGAWDEDSFKKPVQEKFPKYIEPGDWICGKCQAHNFRTRRQCFECRKDNSQGTVFYLEGSWKCPSCTLYVPCKGPLFFLQVMIRNPLWIGSLFLWSGSGSCFEIHILVGFIVEILSYFILLVLVYLRFTCGYCVSGT
jgi:Zn-finger in Ran binding protein and others